jgi:hypothetical protein
MRVIAVWEGLQKLPFEKRNNAILWIVLEEEI